MPPERFPPDDPREWLGRARSNLAHAEDDRPEVALEDLCFDAQQAAEKAIKALLVREKVRLPYIHDLAQLLRLVQDTGIEPPPEIWKADQLTVFATTLRYPSVQEVSQEDYERAIAISRTVVEWVEEQLEKADG